MAMISLDDAYDQAAQSDFWAVRGKAIHAYAGLEQGLAQLFSAVSGVTPKVGGIIFFRISAAIRRTIIEELFRAKFKDEYNLWRNSLFNFRRSTRSAIGSCTGTSSTMSAPTRIIGPRAR